MDQDLIEDFPQYSLEAMNILNLMEEIDYILYVENERNDGFFWSKLIQHYINIPELKIRVQHCGESGGCKSLDKYIEYISEGVLNNAIVARDSDYTLHMENQAHHPKILYTYGYSIENCIYSNENILEIIKTHHRTLSVDVEELKDRLSNFSMCIITLLNYDYINERYGLGISVLGDHCNKFMINPKKNDLLLCTKKIDQQIEEVKSVEKTRQISNQVTPFTQHNFYRWIRGHFLESFICKLLSQYSKVDKKIEYSSMLSIGLVKFIDYMPDANKEHYENIFSNLKKCLLEEATILN